MAFFEDPTKPPLQNYQKQKEVFFSLKTEKNVTPLKDHLVKEHLGELESNQILAIPAIENINLVCPNGEEIKTSLKRLDEFCEQIGKASYCFKLRMCYSETSAGAFTSLIVLYAQFNMFCSTKAEKIFYDAGIS